MSTSRTKKASIFGWETIFGKNYFGSLEEVNGYFENHFKEYEVVNKTCKKGKINLTLYPKDKRILPGDKIKGKHFFHFKISSSLDF